MAVALSKAVELGFQTVGCASTGNLAGSVAANAAAAGLDAYVLIPDGLEQGKVLGTTIYGAKVIAVHGNYDHVNRLCSQIAFRFGWGFVNVNLRPFYAEGSKSMGFEIAEDLGWRAPDHVVAPMAGGSLIGKLHKAFKEFEQLGPARRPGPHPRCSAPRRPAATRSRPRSRPAPQGPADPQSRTRSPRAWPSATRPTATSPRKLIRDTGGWSEDVDDDEIVDAMTLLAETEGIWAETAGGVTARRGPEAHRARPDRPRRLHGPLHHRQRPEDPGSARSTGSPGRSVIEPTLELSRPSSLGAAVDA